MQSKEKNILTHLKARKINKNKIKNIRKQKKYYVKKSIGKKFF